MIQPTDTPPKLPTVFRMNDCEWIMAPSLEEAVEYYSREYHHSVEDIMADEPREMTEQEMADTSFRDHPDDPKNSQTRSFLEELNRRIAAGDVTDFFATTEY